MSERPPAAGGIEPARPLGLDTAALDELCPYAVLVDRGLRVVLAGSVLVRLLRELGGTSFLDVFDVQRPRGATTFESIAARGRRRLAVIQARPLPGLTLRGQFVVLDDSYLLFFGAPVAAHLRDLSDVGLSLDDFPPHSAVTDYLLLAQTQATTAIEAKAMAERLRALNAQLEHRVAERTRRLQAGHARLARYSGELEKMSAQLQHEIVERKRVEAERAHMETELRLAHKLEAVGQLASGIAHEINTPIQFVGDNLRFISDAVADVSRVLQAQFALMTTLEDAVLLDDGKLDDAARGEQVVAALRSAREIADASDLEFTLDELPRAVAEAIEGVSRVGKIVLAMKEFAQADGGDYTYADLNECVETTLVVARNEYRDVAELVLQLDPALPEVCCIPGEVNQVILNLVVNAAHAIAERHAGTGERGTITVLSRFVDDQVELVVRDTGTGIPNGILSRIFDPFFTTKEVGRGTGQGLATCRAIVTTRHGGRLDVSTEPGAGSEFTVRLPVSGPRPGGC